MCARLRIATRWSLFRVKCPFAVRGACQVRGEYIETLSISPSRPRPHSSQAPGGPGTNLFQYFPATWGRLLPLFPQSLAPPRNAKVRPWRPTQGCRDGSNARIWVENGKRCYSMQLGITQASHRPAARSDSRSRYHLS